MSNTTPPTAQFLTVQNKIDAPEKITAVQGKPRAHYWFAQELNKTVAAINILKSLIASSQGQIEQIIATGVKIELGVIQSNVVEVINTSEVGHRIGLDGTTFITCTIDGVLKVYSFSGTPAIYGTTNPMDGEDLILLYDGSMAIIKNHYEFQCTVSQSVEGFYVVAYNDEFTAKGFQVYFEATGTGAVISVYGDGGGYKFFYEAMQQDSPGVDQIKIRQQNARQLYIETIRADVPQDNILSEFYVKITAFPWTSEPYLQPEI